MITATHVDHLTTITINRTDKANALTQVMLQDLNDAVAAAQDARAVIITGGGKVFSAGADLEEVSNGLATDPLWEALSTAIATLPGLTVCAMNGTLAGGAFGMALACDVRIAVPTARFFYPVLRNRLLPQPSDPQRMKALIGPSRTKMLLLAGQKIDAVTALNWGLIDAIATPDGLMDHALDLAAEALAAPLSHTVAIKSLIS